MKPNRMWGPLLLVAFFSSAPLHGQAIDLTEPAISKLFSGTAILKDMNLTSIQEGNGQTTAEIANDVNLSHLGLKVTIKATIDNDAVSVTFKHREPEDASVPLSRRKADMKFSMDASLNLNGTIHNSIISMWEWTPAAGSGKTSTTSKYLVLRIDEQLTVKDVEKVLAKIDVEVPFMDLMKKSAIRHPEIIIPLGPKPIPMVFAIIDAQLAAAKQEVDFYFFRMKGSTAFSMLFDFGNIPIRLVELAQLAADEAGAQDFVKPFETFDPGDGKVRDAAVILTSKQQDLQIPQLDPVMQVPFNRIYATWHKKVVKYPKGLSLIATMLPKDFPNLYQYYKHLGVESQLTITGSIGWRKGAQEADQHLHMRLAAEMSTWEIPLYLADKKLVNSVVDEADIAFFVEWVPASLEMGIETEFHMNDKFIPTGVILDGAFMAQLTSESIAMALGGKMKGTWRLDQYPAATYKGKTVDFRIPFALENVAAKIGISADDTYSVGGRGTAYIGEKSKAKSITLGGKLGIEYTGYEAHPMYFGFLGGANSLSIRDLVTLGNIYLEIESGTWKPWSTSGPLKVPADIDFSLEHDSLYVATPGAGDAYLGFETEGLAGNGVLKYRGKELGKAFFKITKAGVLVTGDLKGFKVGAAGFEGAVVDVSVLADGTPPRFVVRTSVEVGQDSLGVDVDLRVAKQHARIILPRSLKKMVQTSPGQVRTALDKIEKMGINSLSFTFDRAVAAQPAPFKILEKQTLQWGKFVVDNASIWLTEKAGKLSLSIKGQTTLLGNRIDLEGEYLPKPKAYVLRSDLELNSLIGELLSDAALELYWDGTKARAQVAVTTKTPPKTTTVEFTAAAPPPLVLLENQVLTLGKFAVNGARIQLVKVGDKLGLTVDGAPDILGGPVAMKQAFKDGKYLLQSKAAGAFQVGEHNLPYANVELYWVGKKAYAKATVTATEGKSSAKLALEINPPNTCSGTGVADIAVGAFSVKGSAKLTHKNKKTTLTWTVPDGTSPDAWADAFIASVKTDGLKSRALLKDLTDVDYTTLEASIDIGKMGANGSVLHDAKGVLKKSDGVFRLKGKIDVAGNKVAVTGQYSQDGNMYIFTADAAGNLKAGAHTLAYSKMSYEYHLGTNRSSCTLTGKMNYGLGSVSVDGDCSPADDGHFSMTAKTANIKLLGITVPMSASSTSLTYKAGAFAVSYGFADGTSIHFDKTLPALVVNTSSSVSDNKATLNGTVTIDGNSASMSGSADASSLSLSGSASGSWKMAGFRLYDDGKVTYKKSAGSPGEIVISTFVSLGDKIDVPLNVTMTGGK